MATWKYAGSEAVKVGTSHGEGYDGLVLRVGSAHDNNA